MTQKTFSSGIVVDILRVSPLLIAQTRRNIPVPQPPVEVVDYGDGVKRKEKNPAHPDYVAALQEYQMEIESRVRRLLIRRAVKYAITDADREAVKLLREDYEATVGSKLEGDDLELFISYIAMPSTEDMEMLMNVSLALSVPTEEKVAEAAASFPGEVPG